MFLSPPFPFRFALAVSLFPLTFPVVVVFGSRLVVVLYTLSPNAIVFIPSQLAIQRV
jgi:hypothetical protein